jgi:hypothetical protein
MAHEPGPNSQPGGEGGYRPSPGHPPQGGYPQPGYGQPQGYPPPGYPPPGNEPKKRSGLGTAALVLGIIGFVMAVIPFVNFAAYPIVVLAIIFGLIAFRWGKAKAGFILGVLGLIATIAWTAAITSAADDAVNKEHTVAYQVTGTGQVTKADVSYWANDGSNKSSSISQDGQALPFSKTVKVKGSLSAFVLSANTSVSSGAAPKGTLSCSLSVDGKVVSTDHSSGSASFVSCTGSGYDGD